MSSRKNILTFFQLLFFVMGIASTILFNYVFPHVPFDSFSPFDHPIGTVMVLLSLCLYAVFSLFVGTLIVYLHRFISHFNKLLFPEMTFEYNGQWLVHLLSLVVLLVQFMICSAAGQAIGGLWINWWLFAHAVLQIVFACEIIWGIKYAARRHNLTLWDSQEPPPKHA